MRNVGAWIICAGMLAIGAATAPTVALPFVTIVGIGLAITLLTDD